MDWGIDAIERLRALWAEGHSTAEIGRRMGVTKNAIVGKAHRLQLPPRPSPIRRDAAVPVAVPVGRRATLPPFRETPTQAPARTVAVAARVAIQPRPAAVAPPAPRPVPAARPIARSGGRSCCWPIGEPGTPGFRFCTAEAMSPKPYCAEHAAIAYVRVRDRREDAA
jgi:GcrA cell cycle regulator